MVGLGRNVREGNVRHSKNGVEKSTAEGWRLYIYLYCCLFFVPVNCHNGYGVDEHLGLQLVHKTEDDGEHRDSNATHLTARCDAIQGQRSFLDVDCNKRRT